mmetsp:Transcript_82646/g.229317  ORF Transcript_82646/g.229317 Transcript_82646/m.229317 type:complete len:280 (+) Transcript_82646:556-1395(+)
MVARLHCFQPCRPLLLLGAEAARHRFRPPEAAQARQAAANRRWRCWGLLSRQCRCCRGHHGQQRVNHALVGLVLVLGVARRRCFLEGHHPANKATVQALLRGHAREGRLEVAQVHALQADGHSLGKDKACVLRREVAINQAALLAELYEAVGIHALVLTAESLEGILDHLQAVRPALRALRGLRRIAQCALAELQSWDAIPCTLLVLRETATLAARHRRRGGSRRGRPHDEAVRPRGASKHVGGKPDDAACGRRQELRSLVALLPVGFLDVYLQAATAR